MFYLFYVDRKEFRLLSVLNTYLPVCGLPLPDLTWILKGKEPSGGDGCSGHMDGFQGLRAELPPGVGLAGVCAEWVTSRVWGMLRNQLCSLILLGKFKLLLSDQQQNVSLSLKLGVSSSLF